MIHFEIEGKALVEIWKPIKGYEDSYLVSTLGSIKSKPRLGTRGGILKEIYSRWQYNRVNLYKGGEMKSFFIHRLVAKEFLPNPENKPQVNHKDGNKLNNELSNLEWVRSEEHTSELQSRFDIVCRLLLEIKKREKISIPSRDVQA